MRPFLLSPLWLLLLLFGGLLGLSRVMVILVALPLGLLGLYWSRPERTPLMQDARWRLLAVVLNGALLAVCLGSVGFAAFVALKFSGSHFH